MAKNSFQGTEGIFIVYDCTDKESFDKVDEWIKNYDQVVEPHCESVLVCNKVDLPEKRVISKEEGL